MVIITNEAASITIETLGQWCLPRCTSSHWHPSYAWCRYNTVPKEEEPPSVRAQAMAEDILGDPLLLELWKKANWSPPKPKQAICHCWLLTIFSDLLIIPTAVQTKATISTTESSDTIKKCFSQVLYPKVRLGRTVEDLLKGSEKLSAMSTPWDVALSVYLIR